MSPRHSILMALPPTRFRRMRRPTAIAVVLVALAAIALLLSAALRYEPPPAATTPQKGDLAMYGRIANQMRAGADYYQAAHAELLAGGYGTLSVFNWRPPALPWLASRFPSGAWADLALRVVTIAAGLAAAAAVGIAFGFDTGVLAAAALTINLVSAFVPDGAVFADIVAGILILAAVAAYGLGRPFAGAAVTLIALFIRELTAPAVLVFAFLAWREKRRGELALWGIGLVAFAAYFAWHALSVRAQFGPADIDYPSGWLAFGGLDFILATAVFNGLFISAPVWQTAILLPLCLLGLAAWPGPMGTRAGLTVAAYLLLFSVAGKPFDDYWGALYTPLMMLGLALLPAAGRDLATTLRRPSRGP